ncbi:MAG: hypothetical protein CL610_22410 [Anaerolineaceae bacterium]|nr:hypothetical protein [Anaerolineaceae bacterium]
MQETYWSEPQGTYEERRQQYLEYCATRVFDGWLSKYSRTGFFTQIARLELGQQPVDEHLFREAIAFVDSRADCCDFSVAGLLRVLYLYHDSPQISRELIADIEACVLRFKFWWDEDKGDNRRCYWTENHQIIFHADELLAAQLFPDKVFENSGKDADYHMEHSLHLIRRWFDFRARFGFSEWLSNCYFEEDLLALVNLHDFAQQPDIRHLAKQTIDMIMFEMALHTWRGIMGSTHGRTYPRLIKGAREEDASNTARLMFGMGMYNNPASLGTVPLATSPYRCPPVIEKIAADLSGPRLYRERHSINIADAPKHGLSYEDMEDGHLFWSIQDYTHQSIYDLAQKTRQTFGIMLYEDYQTRYDQVLQWQVDEYGKVIDPNVDCHGMTEVHIHTYRTPHYMLSCAQDYRPGKPGYQQHPWQATLGLDAVVFTNHPGSNDETSRPNYWAGNGILPRTAQHQNVLVCVHHVPSEDSFPFNHAYFPRDAFDEVIERGNWVFARKGDGYIGLYSQHPLRWLADENNRHIELRADAPDNIWVVEMGDREQWQDFALFADALTTTPVQCDGLNVTYTSPTVGEVRFGWHGAFQVAGAEVDLHNYARFDNPYCQAEFGTKQYQIRYDGEEAVMDFAELPQV